MDSNERLNNEVRGSEMELEEAKKNSGRFGWRLNSEGERVGSYRQWGEPHLVRGEWWLRNSNGFSEFAAPLEGLRIEWDEEES